MPLPNHPSDSALLIQLASQLDGLARRMDDQTQVLAKVGEQVAHIAVMGERQTAMRESIDRAFQEIRDTQSDIAVMDGRIQALEIAHPANKATANLVQKVGWLVIAGVVGAFLAMVLQRPPTQQQLVLPGAMPQILPPKP